MCCAGDGALDYAIVGSSSKLEQVIPPIAALRCAAKRACVRACVNIDDFEVPWLWRFHLGPFPLKPFPTPFPTQARSHLALY
jgi:hypothetical protein